MRARESLIAKKSTFLRAIFFFNGGRLDFPLLPLCAPRSPRMLFQALASMDLVTVLEAILTSWQPREKLQYLYENLMSNNFRKVAVLKKKKKKKNCKLKLHS